jgi:hypothetical protein
VSKNLVNEEAVAHWGLSKERRKERKRRKKKVIECAK